MVSMKKMPGIMVALMIMAVGAMSALGISGAGNNIRAPVDVTVLNIHVTELSTPTNMGSDLFAFYFIWIDDDSVFTRVPMLYPIGMNILDDSYNISIGGDLVRMEIGAWFTYPKGDQITQLDVSPYKGEVEIAAFGKLYDAVPTWRSNTFLSFYNISSKTFTGDSPLLDAGSYYINGSQDGTGAIHGGIRFALSTFNQTVPGTEVGVDLNLTVENNITLNETPPQVNISVPVPDVYVDVNVSPPNVSAPNVNITQPLMINQSLENLSIPPPIVNITYTPQPLNLSISPPVLNITYSPNETTNTPIVKTSVSSEVQIPSGIYFIIAVLSIGVAIIGCAAIGIFLNMKKMMTMFGASVTMNNQTEGLTK